MADDKKYFCNPLNFEYRYQFIRGPDGAVSVAREAADPSLILFKGRYYLFPSMTGGFLHSEDLARWEFYPLKNFPAYDYAPDVCVVGDYVYLCGSNTGRGVFYRAKDLFEDAFEAIPGTFPFGDPKLFADDDGRLYFYWGCGPGTPIRGVELDPNSLAPRGEMKALIFPDEAVKGFERWGEDHRHVKPEPGAAAALLQQLETLPPETRAAARAYLAGTPYIEGAWMTKYRDRYYLQYAAPGTQFNVYCDAVYVGDAPLGAFTLARNNPFSYKPGGFLPGAGHGSTLRDADGRWWHAATTRISVNHNFERRVGLWRAGFDEDGELFCDQRYGDFPQRTDQEPWETPDFMLLSYGKPARASSWVEGGEPARGFDENARTWWRAAVNTSGEWLEVDLGAVCDTRAAQINFADDALSLPFPEHAPRGDRWIDDTRHPTRWLLEGSVDGAAYFVLADKSAADTDLPHDFVLFPGGAAARYVRLTVIALPYAQAACVSGLRVFGLGRGEKPAAASSVTISREGALDLSLAWEGNAQGYNVLWGFAPDKLYHCVQVFDRKAHVGALVRGQPVYVRIDSFNENGVTEGVTLESSPRESGMTKEE